MLDRLFSPQSVALVGASRTPGKLGHDVLRNMTRYGFAGDIYPVNPSAKRIAGYKTYASILDIPKKVDVAVIAVPSAYVTEVIIQCGKKKIPFAVIISAGFKEVGEDGAAIEAQLKETAKKNNVRLVGPNCLGFLNAHTFLNASFASGMPLKGNISFVSQSGAMGVAMLDWAYQSQLGFAKIISIGNKADIDEVDCLNYFSSDTATKVIMMYLESIEDGNAFMRAAAGMVKKKPIVVLKAGVSEQAKKAVSSHTGSIAGSEEALNAAFQKAGVIRARTVEEFFDFGLALSQQPLPKGEHIAIVTNAGGPGIMAVDSINPKSHLQLPELSTRLQHGLAKALPPAASTKNPVDVLGDASPERYEHALKTVLHSTEIDGVVVILTPQIMTDEDTTAQLIATLQKKYKKPILASFMGGLDVNSGRAILKVNAIPNYDTPERAIKTMELLIAQSQRTVAYVPPKISSRPKRLPSAQNHPQIRTLEAEHLLKKAGMPVVQSQLIRTREECSKLKSFPMVLKIASRDIIHKAASSAVELNIHSVEEAQSAFTRITRAVHRAHPDAEIEGVLAQPQLITNSQTQEVIIGMKRDPSFGPVILFGLGGALVELFHDVALSIAPITLTEAKQMMQQIQTAPLLAHCDTDALARIIVGMSTFSVDYPQLAECDLNPVIVFPKGHGTQSQQKDASAGAQIVDVRMLI